MTTAPVSDPHYPALAVTASSAQDIECICVSRSQSGAPFSLLVIDAATGEINAHPSPLEAETAAPAVAAGTDGAAYLGTRPGARLLRFHPRTHEWEDLGCPCPDETCICCLAAAPDGTIYGGTSPHARLFGYNPQTKDAADLGQIHKRQPDLRHLETDAEGHVYCGLGPEEANLVRYAPESGHKTDLLPKIYRTAGYARPVMGNNDVIYVIVEERFLEIEDTACFPIFPRDFPGQPPHRLGDGREIVGLSGNTLTLKNPETGSETIFELP